MPVQSAVPEGIEIWRTGVGQSRLFWIAAGDERRLYQAKLAPEPKEFGKSRGRRGTPLARYGENSRQCPVSGQGGAREQRPRSFGESRSNRCPNRRQYAADQPRQRGLCRAPHRDLAWLWLYQLWYHVAPFSNSASVDIWAVYLTGIATLLLLLVPFTPGLRDIPRLIPVYRLIWRNWETAARQAVPVGDARTGPQHEDAPQQP